MEQQHKQNIYNWIYSSIKIHPIANIIYGYYDQDTIYISLNGKIVEPNPENIVFNLDGEDVKMGYLDEDVVVYDWCLSINMDGLIILNHRTGVDETFFIGLHGYDVNEYDTFINERKLYEFISICKRKYYEYTIANNAKYTEASPIVKDMNDKPIYLKVHSDCFDYDDDYLEIVVTILDDGEFALREK
jgi:hypothetical protein